MSTGTENSRDRTREAQKLLTLLEQMAAGLDSLYDCLKEQEKALMGWRLADFVATVRKQDRLAKANREREEERKALVAAITGADEPEKLTLRQLAESLGGQWPGRFRKVSERIRQTSGRVAALKEHNDVLIRHSRELVSGQMRMLMELARLGRDLYQPSGRKSGGASVHKVLDHRA